MPNFAIFVSMSVTVAAAALLISERLRPDLIALLVLVVLGLTGVVTPAETFAGFSGSAVITILAISIISEGLHRTGVTHRMGKLMQQAAGQSEWRLILVTMLASAGLSLLMNNIAAVGVLLPAVMSLSRHTHTPPSRLLMPLSFGTLLGGMATLLTTSNIIVSGALKDAGMTPFGLLDFLPVGMPIVIVGTIYMLVVGQRLLPQRNPASEAATQQPPPSLAKMYGIEKNLRRVLVQPGSSMAGQSLRQGHWAEKLGVTVVGLMRGEVTHMAPDRDEVLREGDVLLVQGSPAVEALEYYGLRQMQAPSAPQITHEGVVLAEVVLAPHTTLTGKSLRQIHFREKYGFNVLAIWRQGQPIQTGLADLPLAVGDALLAQGPAARLRVLRAERDYIVLEEDPDPVIEPRRMRVALAITLLTLFVAALGWLPVAQVVLVGAIAMLLLRCLSMDDAYRAIEWKAIFVIAGMWPLSTAIRSSGLADQFIGGVLNRWGDLPPLGMATIMLGVAVVLTQLMGGQVASLVLAPLGLAAAQALGVDGRGMAMAVALGCSLGFPTPFGHPVNVMVMSSGGYTFRDFLRIGAPLTALCALVILIGLRLFWGM